MGYIIKINSESPQALALLNLAKTFDFTEIKKEEISPLNTQQEKFKKKFVKALKETQKIRIGTKKAIPLDTFLNEL